ncbi:PPE family protein [Mycobacterium sp.]|uniref:PPE family protein n=1 Tax=Mycobacterium sp. TaxID=1785 RepID=UPI003D6A1558
MLDFGALPPEVNSGRMYAGPGPGPMLAAAAAWEGLAAELGLAATGYNSVITELTSAPWIGPTSMSMAAAAAPYVSWLSTTAALAEQTASQALAAVAAYEAAFMMTVPPPVIAANRVLLTTLVATNFFGQNTPAIAATEAQYAEMWAQDAAAMYGYAGASATASTVKPFTPPVHTANPAGPTMQAAAVAKAAATPAGTSGQTAAQTTPQLVATSAVPQALQQLSSSPLTASSTSSGSGLTNITNIGTVLKQTLQAYFGVGIVQFFAQIGQQLTFGQGTTAGAGGAWYATPQFAGLGLGNGLSGGPVSASVGQANSIGALSVPAGWAAGEAGVSPTAQGAMTMSAVHAAEGSGPGGLLRGMPLTGVGRRATGGFTHRYGFRYSVMARPPSAG